MRSAPIALFTYNRPEHTRRTVKSLAANDGAHDTDLFIFSDGPKPDKNADAIAEVRAYIRTVSGFKSVNIIEREQNIGLAASIIAGVSATLQRHPNVIVVEDDMLTSRNFLAFMNAALTTYENRSDIFSVTGYNYPLPIPGDYPRDAYLSYRSSSWGWGTWPDRWAQVDWEMKDFASFLADSAAQALFARGGEDLLPMLSLQMEGKLDSWSIRFDYAHYKHNAMCVHPIRSKIQNIGFDGSGVHCTVSDEYVVSLDTGERPFVLDPELQPDERILAIFDQRFRPRASSDRTAAARTASKIAGRVRRLMRAVGFHN